MFKIKQQSRYRGVNKIQEINLALQKLMLLSDFISNLISKYLLGPY